MNLASPTRALRIALASIVFAVAGSFTLAANAQQAPHDGPGMFMGMGHGHMLDRMLTSVNATDQQRAQIKQILQAAHTDLQAQRQANSGLHQQMMQAFAQPTVDPNAVESLRKQQMAAHDQASQRMMKAMIDVSNVLTPDQRKTLVTNMQKRSDMMQRHMRERQELEGTKPTN
jgi:Spy/CpxP family protein refolding chaperone